MSKPSLFVLLTVIALLQFAHADISIPEDEILGYFDSSEIYTIVGAVKNTEDYPVIPTVHLTITEIGNQIEITHSLPTVFPNKDIPFKIKIPQVTNVDVMLSKYYVTFEKDTRSVSSSVEVVYDRSLIKHSDGHLVGKIMNKGNVTEYNVKVYATIHGQNNSFIDVATNLEKIDKIEPGQILEFTMYPDPSLADEVHYYSCFALGDETIVPLYATRNGEKFNFRYDSTASFVAKGFDETGTKLSLVGINSFKFPTYVNFEFPKISDDEKFEVQINQKPVTFIQSIDEQGNWHVAFDVEGTTQNQILITGFADPRKLESPMTSEPSIPEPTQSSDDVSVSKHDSEPDYSFLYYVAPIIAAIIIGVFACLHKIKSTV